VQSPTHYLAKHSPQSSDNTWPLQYMYVAAVLPGTTIKMISANQRPSVKECGDAGLKACLLLLMVTVLPETTMSYPVNYRPIIGNVQISCVFVYLTRYMFGNF